MLQCEYDNASLFVCVGIDGGCMGNGAGIPRSPSVTNTATTRSRPDGPGGGTIVLHAGYDVDFRDFFVGEKKDTRMLFAPYGERLPDLCDQVRLLHRCVCYFS